MTDAHNLLFSNFTLHCPSLSTFPCIISILSLPFFHLPPPRPPPRLLLPLHLLLLLLHLCCIRAPVVSARHKWMRAPGGPRLLCHTSLTLSLSITHTHTGPASLCPMQAVPPGCHGNLQSVFRGWRPIVLSSHGMDGALGGWSRIAWSACSRLVQTRLTLRLFGCFCYLLLVFLKIFSNYFLQIHIFFVSCCFSVWNGKFPARRRGATSVTNDITRRFFSRASNQRHLETRQAPPPTRNTRHHAGNTKIKHFSSFKVALHEFRKKPFCSSVH